MWLEYRDVVGDKLFEVCLLFSLDAFILRISLVCVDIKRVSYYVHNVYFVHAIYIKSLNSQRKIENRQRTGMQVCRKFHKFNAIHIAFYSPIYWGAYFIRKEQLTD